MDINDNLNLNNSTKLNCGLLNVQSVGNKTLDIYELIIDKKLDVLALTETWLNMYDTAKIKEMTPNTHTFIHIPRSGKRGGGVGIFLQNSFKKIKIDTTRMCESFEKIQISCEINRRKCVFVVVYRPPNSRKSLFIQEFRTYLETVDTVGANVLICGDFNLWIEASDDYYVSEFIEMMNSFNFVNKVIGATSISEHTLDLVFAEVDRDFVCDVNVDEVCCISPVHKLVTFRASLNKESILKKKISIRLRNNFQPEVFISSVSQRLAHRKSEQCSHGLVKYENCANCFTKLFNDSVREKYNEVCPMVEKEIIIRDHAPWFNAELMRMKAEKQRKERLWRRFKSNYARREYQEARNRMNRMVVKRKRDYYKQKVDDAGSDINKLYTILDNWKQREK